MQFESFIAGRILKGEGNKVSRPIINITVAAISVGVALMILSLVVLKGFQNEIRNKVIGFGSHITILPAGNNYSKESIKFVDDLELRNELKDHPSVKHVQGFALKPGILETEESIHGVLIKGIGSDFDWTFFNKKLIEGEAIVKDSTGQKKHILISKYIADRMELNVGDKVTTYFVQNTADIKPRTFIISGIYETGLPEFDEKYVYVDIYQIQKISNWGLEAQIRVSKSCYNDSITIEGLAFGGDGDHNYQWNGIEVRGSGPHKIPSGDYDNIRLIVSDASGTLADTAFVDISLEGKVNPCDSVVNKLNTTGGSYSDYIGGYEILINDYADLKEMDKSIFRIAPIKFQTQTILQQYPEIFNWLEMLDLNVYIIIGLMIFIALINMTSAILIIILEKTRLIGLFGAFGASEGSIIEIFLRTALRVVLKGLVLGNVIGIGLAFIQWKFGIISLNPSDYFVDRVPIDFDWESILLLNLGTAYICWAFMGLPALYVSRISPVKAIKFD